MNGYGNPFGMMAPPPIQQSNPLLNLGALFAGFAQGQPLGGFQLMADQQARAQQAQAQQWYRKQVLMREAQKMRMAQAQRAAQQRAGVAALDPLLSMLGPDVAEEHRKTLEPLAQAYPEAFVSVAAARALPKPALRGKERYLPVGERLYDLQTGQWIGAGPGGQPPAKITDVSSMRKEFTTESKPWSMTREAFEKMAASKPTGVGDINLLIGYMKMLDPTSVVREGEFATAANAGGVPDFVRNLYNKAITGERLSPELRAQFLNQASAILDTQRAQQLTREQTYSALAGRWGARSEDIVRDLLGPYRESVPSFAAEGLGGKKAATAGGKVTVSPESDDYMKLYGNQ